MKIADRVKLGHGHASTINADIRHVDTRNIGSGDIACIGNTQRVHVPCVAGKPVSEKGNATEPKSLFPGSSRVAPDVNAAGKISQNSMSSVHMLIAHHEQLIENVSDQGSPLLHGNLDVEIPMTAWPTEFEVVDDFPSADEAVDPVHSVNF